MSRVATSSGRLNALTRIVAPTVRDDQALAAARLAVLLAGFVILTLLTRAGLLVAAGYTAAGVALAIVAVITAVGLFTGARSPGRFTGASTLLGAQIVTTSFVVLSGPLSGTTVTAFAPQLLFATILAGDRARP